MLSYSPVCSVNAVKPQCGKPCHTMKSAILMFVMFVQFIQSVIGADLGKSETSLLWKITTNQTGTLRYELPSIQTRILPWQDSMDLERWRLHEEGIDLFYMRLLQFGKSRASAGWTINASNPTVIGPGKDTMGIGLGFRWMFSKK